jgi:hypothetical protein
MIRINPDPHTGGYVYFPARAVTAMFPAGCDVQPVLRELAKAGFMDDRIDVFTGKKGAKELDLEGQRHGLWVRFTRGIEELFEDEYEEFEKAQRTLDAGGSVVAVFTLKDLEKKRQAASILKNHHGQDVMYWGPWLVEYL